MASFVAAVIFKTGSIKPYTDLLNNLHSHLLIIQLLGHCIATWYAMSRSLVKITEMGLNQLGAWLDSSSCTLIFYVTLRHENIFTMTVILYLKKNNINIK